MPTSAIVRLEKVLDLEERQGYRNRSVMGGLQAMAGRWAQDARAEQVAPELIQRVEPEMVAYASSDPASRPALVARLRALLKGDLSAGGAPAPDRAATQVEPQAAQKLPAAPPLPGGSGSDRPATPPVRPTPKSAPKPAPGPAAKHSEVQPPTYSPAPRPDQPAPRPDQPAPRPDQPAPRPDQPVPTVSSEISRVLESVPASDEAAAPGDNAPTYVSEGGIGSSVVYAYEEPPPTEAGARPQRTGNRPPRSPSDLKASTRILQGVGPSVQEQLQRLGIETVEDLIWHLPADYDDFSARRKISDVRPDDQVTMTVNLWDVRERSVGINKTIVEGIFADGTGTLSATWWNKYVRNSLRVGQTYRLSGKVGLYHGNKTISNPAFEEEDTEAISTGRITPVYRLTEGLSQKKLRQLTRQVLEDLVQFVPDVLPPEIIERYHLLGVEDALRQIHYPESREELAAAERRLQFEELFYVQLGVEQRRGVLKAAAAPPVESDDALLQSFADALPFALTGAQQRVLAEAASDMRRSVPMTRLVQGDVGSGKTAIAAGSMWIAARSGLQSAMLAPTQILAEQHHRGIQRLLENVTRVDGEPMRVALLTGRVTGGERADVLEGLRSGGIDVVVGTTALIQEGVEFAELGLVVVDEQHRFGVEQRGALRSSADTQPHLLVMSATPIPRSLALTVFGDLDLSTLDEMPPGRRPVKTVLFHPNERERVYGFVRKEAQTGRQAFIVYPLVEESDKLEAGAATVAFEQLQKEVFPDLRLALLHGQMKGSEKDAIMSAFAAGEHDVLVSTSVIEVGIDVPNATVMMIEDADRFGLAQLHQFRGRVGRGPYPSFCVLVSRAETESAQERLNVLAQTNDGFVLAEKDLMMRGPGDFLGTRQSGLPNLRLARFTDLETMAIAREAAQSVFEVDPSLSAHPELLEQVQRFWRGEGDIS